MHDTNDSSVRALVLAGVHRWGESAFGRLLPPPLMPIANTPLICYVLRWLRDAEVQQTTICANSDSRPVRRYLGDGVALGLDLHYYEDLTPRGPAGCVRDAGAHWPARDLVVAEGNVIPSVDLPRLLAIHRRTGAAITVVVEPDTSNGPTSDALPRPAGIYVFARRSLTAVPATGYQDIKEVLIPKLHDQGEHVLAYPANTICPRIRDSDTYLIANEWLIERIAADSATLPGYRRNGQALVHEEARLAESVRLVGPILIGAGTRVGMGSTVVGPAAIGEQCAVEEGAVVCRSVVWNGCHIGRGAIVDRSILAFGAVVAAEARSRNVLHIPDEGRPPLPGRLRDKDSRLPSSEPVSADSRGPATGAGAKSALPLASHEGARVGTAAR